MNYKNAVLQIWYTFNGKPRAYPQGKIYQDNGKWVYLQDMTPNTLWRNFNGYSIAEQVLDAFSRAKIRPQIIYRERHKGQLLYATPTLFKKKGIKANYGGHTQYILCLGYWKAKQGNVEDPHGLPVMELSKWLKGEQRIEWVEGGFKYL